MRTRCRLLAAVLLLALPLVAQDYEEPSGPYFSLHSSRTYAPGEKPSVQVSGRGIRALDFRVYRVKDPVAFFASLKDLHAFGGQAPPVPHEPTWLEDFHSFKHRIFVCIRDFFRYQFSEDSRASIRDWMSRRGRKPVEGKQSYAQLPLLNSQQVVSVWRQEIPPSRGWEMQSVSIDVPGKGVYLVEAIYGGRRAYSLVMVSDIAIVTKESPGKTLAFVVDRATGVPLQECPVVAWANQKEIGRFQTDEDGLAEFRFADPKVESVVIMAKQGDSFAVNAPPYFYMQSDPERGWEGYVYTDRPVYRPGDTVHYKAILRQLAGSQYRVVTAQPVSIEIRDSEYKPVYQGAGMLSAMGTVAGDFAVPVNASLGDYSIHIKAGQTGGTGSFYVEEYKKPEYEVKITPERKRVLEGDSVKAVIEAKYFFGEPVANAQVKWVVHRSLAWFYGEPDEEDQAESDQPSEENDYAGEQLSEQAGKLDADGRMTIAIPTTVSDKKYDYNYRVEARVTDPGNREIAGHNFVLATFGSFHISIRPDTYVYEPGTTAHFTVEARDYDNKPVSTPFHVEFGQWSWRDTKWIGSGVQTADGRTDANGSAKVDLKIVVTGSVRARVTATTPENRELENWAYAWVPASGAPWWARGGEEQIQLIADKKSYKPGDIAKVLIITGIADAHVLVTTEGRELYTRQVIAASGGSATVEVPIRGEYEPNFYVSATFIQKGKLYQGSKSLNVPPDEHRLNVEVHPAKDQYKPGEKGALTIMARDQQGNPVAGEFSLGLVDEAIYSIHPDLSGDPLRTFYGHVWNRVGTDSSLTYYFWGQSTAHKMQLTQLRPRAMAQIKPERLVEPKIRKAFPDTMLWIPVVRTDASGRAQVPLEFPDALTTWRATVRGVSADTKLGGAVQHVLVRKNLILRLVVPRFFRQGDEITISALVHNYLTSTKTARVSLDVEGLEIVNGRTQDVTIASKAEAKVDWRVRPRNVREAKVLGKALTDEESDAMELTLPIEPFGVKLAIARAGAISDANGETQQDIEFPAKVEPASRSLELSVTPSIAGAVFGALEYLTSYPYGCTEQTMSSFLPNIVVAQSMKELGVKSNVNQADLERKIRAGLDRLYDYQHEDGGWGWWKTDDSQVFMTAYVIAGLAQAQAAGYELKDDVLENGRKWLKAQFDRDPRIAADLRAYMVFALVLSGNDADTNSEKAVISDVWAQRSKLTAYGEALLGLSLAKLNDSRAEELASQLEGQAKIVDDQAHWKTDHDYLMETYAEPDYQATAFAMKLLTRLRPTSELLPKAALWLLSNRNQGYYWDTTEQTAMVIYGLTDYLKLSGELKPDFSVEVLVNDKPVLSRHFTAANAMATSPPVIRLSEDQLSLTTNRVRIRKTGQGRLYWSARADYFSTEGKFTNTGKIALSLARECFKLLPERKDERIVYRLDRLSGPVAVGDIIAVHLTVSGDDWRYLMIEDPIPSGTEFIERDDLYELKDRISWWGFWFTRREFHDNRVALFQTWFYHGQREYFYLLKVVNPGTFRVSPARVQPMYQPQLLATSDSETVVVK